MQSAKRAGRAVGLALLIPMLLSPPLYAVWLEPLSDPGFLTTLSDRAMQIRLALLLLLAFGSMTLTVAILALPVFRRYSERMALTFLAMSLLVLVTIVMESLAIRDMLALSLDHARSGTPTELMETLAGLARSRRISAHFTNLVCAHATMLLLHLILYRFMLVPRTLAAAGIATAVVSTAAVTMPLLGYGLVFLLIAPMGLTSLALGVWLLVRGFAEADHSRRGDGSPHEYDQTLQFA